MTCRPDKGLFGGSLAALPGVLFTALLVLLALPALAGTPNDPLAEAAAAIERGDGVSAEVDARRALSQGKPHAAVDAYLGEAAMLQDDPDSARNWLAPGKFDAASAQRGFYALGRLELAAGRYGPAAKAFDQALLTGGANARLWVDIGRLRYLAGEQHLAAGAVTRALAINPEEPRALAFQAELVRDSQGLAASLPWFERAIKVAPKDLDLVGEYAATLGDLGRYKEMLSLARYMVKTDRSHPRAYFLEAVLAARAGEDDIARRLLWLTKGQYDDTAAGMLLEGVLDYRSGNATLAVEKFDELSRRQPDNQCVTRLLGRALLADGDASEVVARFAPLVARPEASAYMLTLVARAYEQMDRRDLAAPLLDRAAHAASEPIAPLPLTGAGELAIYRYAGGDPLSAEVAVPTLRKMLGEGRMADVAAYATRLSQRYPNSSDIQVAVGDAALLAGDPAAARRAYGLAAEVRWTAMLALRIAAADSRLGQGTAAEAQVTDYLAQHPQDRALAALLGRDAAAKGDWRRAAVLLGHAAALPGGAADPQVLAELAQAQLHLGKAPAALVTAERAYALQRAGPAPTRALAAALEATGGRGNGAEVLLAKARSMDGEPALALR